MNLFVTGSNGYIGRNFIKTASKKGINIYAVTRKKIKKEKCKMVGRGIDKNWKEFKNSDVLIHFATVGTYDKNILSRHIILMY